METKPIPENILQVYLDYCYGEGRALNTIRGYRDYLKRFIPVMAEVYDKPTFVRYLAHYENDRSRHTVFRTIKVFIRWGAARGYWPDWITGIRIKFAKAPDYPTLTVAEFESIIGAIPQKARRVGERQYYMHRAFFSLLFYSACRRGAILGLRPGDVDLDAGSMAIVTKGGREAIMPIVEPALSRLREWVEVNPSKEWVFPSPKREEMAVTGGYMSHRLNRYARAAGISKRVWIHGLRHSAATVMAQAGVGIDVISACLLHNELSTTQIYISKLINGDRIKHGLAQAFGKIGVLTAPRPAEPLRFTRRPDPVEECDFI